MKKTQPKTLRLFEYVHINLSQYTDKLLYESLSATVGEALSLPRSTGFQLLTRMGEERTTLNIVPFNRTLNLPTWREAASLPYSGWADHWALRMFMNSSPVMVSFS